MWNLHVFPVFTWVSSHHKDMQGHCPWGRHWHYNWSHCSWLVKSLMQRIYIFLSHIIKLILPWCSLSAVRMFSLMPRCMVHFLNFLQLGSHLLWSRSTLTFLWLLWEMEKEECGGKEKGKQKNGILWIGKQLRCSRRQGCFVEQRAYSSLNVTSF